LVEKSKMPADCFSCARCLNICPDDAIHYKFVLQTKRGKKDEI
jgi:formate hydrogenlyase subunit 6/NADH:ubiquinone oxidoreductase subunit I